MVRGEKDNGHADKKSCRLPKCVAPDHYTLLFVPNMTDPVLEGHMEVRVDVRNAISLLLTNRKFDAGIPQDLFLDEL